MVTIQRDRRLPLISLQKTLEIKQFTHIIEQSAHCKSFEEYGTLNSLI